MLTVRGVGMPKTTEKYIAVVHYEAGDPSATVFAIDDTARQAIATAKGEKPDELCVLSRDCRASGADPPGA
jgi:hypothetical protein